MASPQRFLGNSLLQWNNMAAASVPWHVELMFRTRQASATLLHISSGLQHNLTLQVRATHAYTSSHCTWIHTNSLSPAFIQVPFCLRPSCVIHFFLSTVFTVTEMLQCTAMPVYSPGETLIRNRKAICHLIWAKRKIVYVNCVSSVTECEH